MNKIPKGQFSKFIITLVVTLNVIYTIIILYIFFKIGSEPTVLTSCWFAFTTGELFMLANIKNKKIVNSNSSNSDNNNIYHNNTDYNSYYNNGNNDDNTDYNDV